MAVEDPAGITGYVVWELFDEDGNLKARGEGKNLVTDVGDQMYADRAVQVQGSAKTITAITNATTAVVTTSAAHGYGVGDVVTIAGVTPAGYNGKWAITAVGSATTFSIYVGTALGAGSAFGTSTGPSFPVPQGMKLGTGLTAVAKNGAGGGMVTYVSNSHQAFDATFPSTSGTSGGRIITYKVTFAAGKATSATAISEAVMFLDFLADATSSVANTVARVLLAGGGAPKGASDTLTITWTNTVLGA